MRVRVCVCVCVTCSGLLIKRHHCRLVSGTPRMTLPLCVRVHVCVCVSECICVHVRVSYAADDVALVCVCVD